jgi:quinoprotein glucose dehydrogenase
VDGTIYFSTPLNIVVAIDAATGEERWRFDPGAWQEEDFLFGFHRGVSYSTLSAARRSRMGVRIGAPWNPTSARHRSSARM